MSTSSSRHRGFFRRMHFGAQSHVPSSEIRSIDKRNERLEILEETAAAEDFGFDFSPHVFAGGRCLFCGIDFIDDTLYGPHDCTPHEDLVWTTPN